MGSVRPYEARTHLGLGSSRCPTPTLLITLNYVIFSQITDGIGVSGVRVRIRASYLDPIVLSVGECIYWENPSPT